MSQESNPSSASVGVLLSDERVRRGISIQQAADYLKLSKKQIEALEKDDYRELPGATFVRGFVRNYAKYLELDPAKLMAMMDESLPPVVQNVNAALLAAQQAEIEAEADVPASLTSASASMAGNSNASSSGNWWVWLLVLAGLGGGGYFAMGGLQMNQAPFAVQEEAAQTPAPAPKVEAPVPAESVSPNVEQTTTQSVATAESTNADAQTATTNSNTTLNLPEGMELLKIVPHRDSWMEVRDSTGERLVYGTQVSGRVREVMGKPPFKLIIGNATEVEVTYKNEVIPMKNHLKKGTTARLELK